MNACEQYARWVLAEENSTKNGRLMKLAAQRFLNDLEREDIYFDTESTGADGANFLVDFGQNHCLQWEGDWEGKPVIWQDWQKFVFMQVYGWKIKSNGRRRFHTVYVQIAKKNGKSTMSAVLADGHVFADTRVNTPKVFTAANNEDQAKISVNMAGQIVKASPDLHDYIEDESVKLMTYGKDVIQVIHRERNGFIMALSKETDDAKSKTAGGKHGINASLGIVDEFGMSKDYGASGAIRTSMASRSERLMFYITTAGYNREGPCYTDLRENGIKVLEGLITMDDYLPIIFEMDQPEGKEITIDYLLEHPEVWQQSNPNLGVSVYEDFLRDELLAGKQKGGRVAADCLTLNFNLWVDSPTVFIPADVWNANAHGTEIESLLGQECYGGLETGTGTGLGAFALYFPGEINKILLLSWISEKGFEENEIYKQWADHIKVDPGNVVDNDVAVQWIMDFVEKYDMRSFTWPISNKTDPVAQGLIKQGKTGHTLSQGINGISTPITNWERNFISEKMEHFNNPVLAWSNSNCLIVRKETGIRIEKNQKVLPIYACINAVAEQMTIDAEGMGTLGIIYI